MHPKSTIEAMQKLAASRDGKCLSNKYINSSTKLTWQCSAGHVWKATPSNVKHKGSWCPHCSGVAKGGLSDLRKLAIKRGGKCLSTEYFGTHHHHRWQCQQGHQWEAIPSNIKRGQWCPDCAGRTPKTIEDMHRLAAERDGVCLSKNYRNAHQKLHWRCRNGHEWRAIYNSIQQGTWCPECGKKSSERICRAYFESIFGVPFPTRRPEWLKNARGNRMELDGYAESIALAFEYQGAQHYQHHKYFHRSSSEAKRRQKDDEQKARLCKLNGVALIEVPYSVSRDDLRTFIVQECKNFGVAVPNRGDKVQIDLQTAYSYQWMDELREIARERGGECLSKGYIDAHTKIRWRCSEGHEWDAIPSNVKKGSWCPHCSGNAALTIDDMHKLARQRGGKCLSESIVNSITHLEWACEKGHKWLATPSNLVNAGSWCPECANERRFRKAERHAEMVSLAESRGGRFLSVEYINSGTLHDWECSKRHRWQSTPGHVKRGQWCPKCAGNKKGTIDEMHELASRNKGKCLSESYRNSRTKLRWECAAGHRWEKRPTDIQQGSWCPECTQRRQRT